MHAPKRVCSWGSAQNAVTGAYIARSTDTLLADLGMGEKEGNGKERIEKKRQRVWRMEGIRGAIMADGR